MTQTNAPSGVKVLTLKVTLIGSNPPIWRRFQIRDCVTLGDLHYAIQIVMGWTDDHLHEFRIGRKRFAAILDDDYFQESLNDEEEVELRDVLKRKGTKFQYIYDFGDGWMHQVVVEERSEPQPGGRYPVCMDGEGSCPPEDCGGMGGYYNMLEILEDPEHEEYTTYREWLSEDFDPDDFDIDKANKELERMDQWRRIAEGEDDFENFSES